MLINIDHFSRANIRRAALEKANQLSLTVTKISHREENGHWHSQYQVSGIGAKAKPVLVTFVLTDNATFAHCECGTKMQPCYHILAALLKESEKRVYSPTKSLIKSLPQEGDRQVVSFNAFLCSRGDMGYHFDDDEVVGE